MTPDGPAASKTLQRLRSRISMPIVALAWTGFPYIRKSRQGKSVPWVSVSAGTSRFRAAFQPDVRATVCYYGMGIHDGKLGQDANAGSLARAREIRGELLMIFGTKDPHVPDAGREMIDRALKKSGVRYNTFLYPTEQSDQPFTNIETDGRWKALVHLGIQYAALLVDPTYNPPEQTESLPIVGNGAVALAVVLRISGSPGKWTAAELKLTRSLGYGTYRFQVRDVSGIEN